MPIDQNLLKPLSAFLHLTELTLINFDFVAFHPRLYPVTSVTKLTVSSVISPSHLRYHLLRDFCTEHDPERPSVNRLDVQLFRRALFDQFPNLKQLTLIGNVYQHQVARERLAREFDGHLERLDMFFRNKIARPPGRIRQTARKGTGGKAARMALPNA